jgi:phosphate transport system permease protein
MTAVATRARSDTRTIERQLRGGGPDITGIIFRSLLMLALAVSIGVLAVLLIDVVSKAIEVFQERGVGDFLAKGRSSLAIRSGVRDALWGTLAIGVIVVAIAFPMGVAAAIYLEEYAPKNRFTSAIDVNIRNLAGVPSVVYGLLGLTIFVQLFDRSALAAGLTMAVLVLPIVIITAAEAIRSVPDSLREAGYGVGATRWEVTKTLTLPYAAPGILTGTVLSLMRALGEAAPLIVIGAVTGVLNVPGSVFDKLTADSFTALPIYIFATTREANNDFRVNTAAAIVVLLLIVLAFNTAAILLRNRYEKRRVA